MFKKNMAVCIWDQKSTEWDKQIKAILNLLVFVQPDILKCSEAIHFKWHPESGSKSVTSIFGFMYKHM